MLTILQGDCLLKLRGLLDGSVQCCVTSPPYWGLRDYGIPPSDWPEMEYVPMAGLPAVKVPAMSCCLGLEKTPEAFIGHIVLVFREVRRVLRKDGTCWVNFGDSYQGAGLSGGKKPAINGTFSFRGAIGKGSIDAGLKSKDLVGVPWRVAFALQADGWYLRSDIIWHKPNPMPESVTDRPTKAHEYIFLLTKSERYFYDADAITEDCSPNTHARISQNLAAQIGSQRANGGAKTNGNMKAVFKSPKTSENAAGVKNNQSFAEGTCLAVVKRNKRTVWSVPTFSFKEAHFATYPPDLIKPCILSGTKPGDVVLDPFGGSGTTGQVAIELGRSAVLIELNEKYIPLIEGSRFFDCRFTPALKPGLFSGRAYGTAAAPYLPTNL